MLFLPLLTLLCCASFLPEAVSQLEYSGRTKFPVSSQPDLDELENQQVVRRRPLFRPFDPCENHLFYEDKGPIKLGDGRVLKVMSKTQMKRYAKIDPDKGGLCGKGKTTDILKREKRQLCECCESFPEIAFGWEIESEGETLYVTQLYEEDPPLFQGFVVTECEPLPEMSSCGICNSMSYKVKVLVSHEMIDSYQDFKTIDHWLTDIDVETHCNCILPRLAKTKKVKPGKAKASQRGKAK